MPLTSGRATRGPAGASPRPLRSSLRPPRSSHRRLRSSPRSLRSSPRSLRSAVLAVCVTGVLSIGIPFGLLLGKGDLVPAGANRQTAVPAPQLAGCSNGQPIKDRVVRPGQCVLISGHGLGGHQLIEVTESHRPGWRSYLRADALGGFSWRYRLPANASDGADVLTFVGTNATAAAVPATAFCPFTVAG